MILLPALSIMTVACLYAQTSEKNTGETKLTGSASDTLKAVVPERPEIKEQTPLLIVSAAPFDLAARTFTVRGERFIGRDFKNSLNVEISIRGRMYNSGNAQKVTLAFRHYLRKGMKLRYGKEGELTAIAPFIEARLKGGQVHELIWVDTSPAGRILWSQDKHTLFAPGFVMGSQHRFFDKLYLTYFAGFAYRTIPGYSGSRFALFDGSKDVLFEGVVPQFGFVIGLGI